MCKPYPMHFQRMNRLEHLDISSNAFLGSVPATLQSSFQNLPSLEMIDIHGCGIEELPVGMFDNTSKLTTVVLSGNAIKSWNPDVFAPLRHLQILTLARNKIVSVNIASFSQLTSLQQLDLSLNPFACNCDLMWFLEYVQKENIFIINIGQASAYACASPESLRGVHVLRSNLSHDDCISHTDLIIALSTAAAILISAIVFSVVYKARWYIRYYFFLIRSRRRRYMELTDGRYAYDAFVAHSSDDRVWVVRHLLPRIESEGRYRLCLHQRDWLAGKEISENIVESIEASRKVIIVLSNSFARSRWCQVELAMASNSRLRNRCKSLILVLLETITPENETATMRCMLTTHTYLEWNEAEENKFWKALRKALRRPLEQRVEMRSIE